MKTKQKKQTPKLGTFLISRDKCLNIKRFYKSAASKILDCNGVAILDIDSLVPAEIESMDLETLGLFDYVLQKYETLYKNNFHIDMRSYTEWFYHYLKSTEYKDE